MEPDKRPELPDLPPSDHKSLQWNLKDHFYETTTREFWGENQISHYEVEEWKECDHDFQEIIRGQQVQCQKCHVGYFGDLEIRDGKLFFKGHEITGI